MSNDRFYQEVIKVLRNCGRYYVPRYSDVITLRETGKTIIQVAIGVST